MDKESQQQFLLTEARHLMAQFKKIICPICGKPIGFGTYIGICPPCGYWFGSITCSKNTQNPWRVTEKNNIGYGNTRLGKFYFRVKRVADQIEFSRVTRAILSSPPESLTGYAQTAITYNRKLVLCIRLLWAVRMRWSTDFNEWYDKRKRLYETGNQAWKEVPFPRRWLAEAKLSLHKLLKAAPALFEAEQLALLDVAWKITGGRKVLYGRGADMDVEACLLVCEA